LLDAFQQPGGQHGVFDIAALDLGHQVLRRLGRRLHRVDHQPDRQQQRQPQACLAKFRLFHKCPRMY
jgi:hypothetical protein